MPPIRVPDQDFAFYCDEAGISNDRFTVVGGVCLHRSSIEKVLVNIEAFRKKHNMTKELKWTKITNDKIVPYQELVEYFFAMNNTNLCQFHCVIFDNNQWRHKKYNNGDADIGLSKLYYQIMHHRIGKNCGVTGTIYVRLDHRNSSTSLNDLRDMLNQASARDHGIATRPFKAVESADSKECDILQMNDVILGAICAARNGKHLLENGRAAKRQIANIVLAKSGVVSLEKDTPRGQNRFSVWNFRPRA